MDSPLYAPIMDRSETILQHAFQLYHSSFTHAFELTQQMRQQGITDMDRRFQIVLSNLRTGEVQKEDWEFLQTHVLA